MLDFLQVFFTNLDYEEQKQILEDAFSDYNFEVIE